MASEAVLRGEGASIVLRVNGYRTDAGPNALDGVIEVAVAIPRRGDFGPPPLSRTLERLGRKTRQGGSSAQIEAAVPTGVPS
jgi:hypothetical protein